MLDGFLFAVAAFLLLNVCVALVRVLLGRTNRDRLLGVLLVGTTAAAVFTVLAVAAGVPALRDLALAVVALAAVVVVVHARMRGTSA